MSGLADRIAADLENMNDGKGPKAVSVGVGGKRTFAVFMLNGCNRMGERRIAL